MKILMVLQAGMTPDEAIAAVEAMTEEEIRNAFKPMEPQKQTEAAEETQEENGQAISEINPHCMTCAHGGDNAEFCEGAGYDCDKCTIIRCICKRCTDCNQWEPKGGAAW
jgi:hypothetical protein